MSLTENRLSKKQPDRKECMLSDLTDRSSKTDKTNYTVTITGEQGTAGNNRWGQGVLLGSYNVRCLDLGGVQVFIKSYVHKNLLNCILIKHTYVYTLYSSIKS